jgi:hypothetical protein
MKTSEIVVVISFGVLIITGVGMFIGLSLSTKPNDPFDYSVPLGVLAFINVCMVYMMGVAALTHWIINR